MSIDSLWQPPKKPNVHPEINMSHFGLLVRANPPSHPNSAGREACWECIFDTGIVMYFPPALFNGLNMLFPTAEGSRQGI